MRAEGPRRSSAASATTSFWFEAGPEWAVDVLSVDEAAVAKIEDERTRGLPGDAADGERSR